MAFAGIDDGLGYQQFTCDTSTGLTLTSPTVLGTPAYFLIKPEAQAVRWRDDGVAPTATVGQPLAAGEAFKYDSKNIAKLRFISQTAGGIINATAYGKLP
jgi:hypothetical protein